MKKITFLSAALVAACMSFAQNGAYLEYKISSSKGFSGSMKASISEYGSLSEFNMAIPQMPGGGISNKSLVQSSNPEVIYTINDKSKTYSEIKRADNRDENKTYTVKKLGDETVNGYKCAHALVTEGNESHEVWNTKDLAEYQKYAHSFGGNKNMGSRKMEQALKDAGCDGIPVKAVHKGNEREGDMNMELVKLEKHAFSKSGFDLPAGYTKSAGYGGMQGMQGGGMKSQQELMSMTPEERAKYIEEMKKAHGK